MSETNDEAISSNRRHCERSEAISFKIPSKIPSKFYGFLQPLPQILKDSASLKFLGNSKIP
ncbi:MAG: hypothetical protein SOW03_07010 [Campylobacter sp.]|nr:hypothetical protein [Campylobacteraceae bacterium]MDY2636072.1 hypothetical protein [Campylobacter sp.]